MIASPHSPPDLEARAPLAGPDGGQRLTLDNVAWADYEAIGRALAGRANLRLTYDRGRLELMTLSPRHERLKYLIGRLVDVLTDELNLQCAGFGSTTYKEEAAEKGLEPDQCYYSASLDRVRNKDAIDLRTDPPPDLAVEIDVSRSSAGRLPIYAALKVPEVWRLRGDAITVYQLNPAGGYDEHPTSSAFAPDFPASELVRFLEIGLTTDGTPMARAFRAWFRQWADERGLTS